MASLNQVQLIGHLGADPEVRTFANGGKVANFRLATSEKWKDRQTGEVRERTEWHSVSVLAEGLVRVVEQYLRKGAKVFLQGRLETRKWQDQEGRDRYTTEIVLRPYQSSLVMCGGGQGGGQAGASGAGAGAPAGYGAGQGSGGSPIDDDEIPF